MSVFFKYLCSFLSCFQLKQTQCVVLQQCDVLHILKFILFSLSSSVIHQHPEEEDVKPFTSFFIHYYTSKMLTVDIPNLLLADDNVR